MTADEIRAKIQTIKTRQIADEDEDKLVGKTIARVEYVDEDMVILFSDGSFASFEVYDGGPSLNGDLVSDELVEWAFLSGEEREVLREAHRATLRAKAEMARKKILEQQERATKRQEEAKGAQSALDRLIELSRLDYAPGELEEIVKPIREVLSWKDGQ